MSKRTPGLRKKGEIWHIEKVIAGQLIRCSTGETELDNAERFLAKLIEERRNTVIYGQRTDHTFDQAAGRYLDEKGHLKSISREINSLRLVMPYIGQLPVRKIHSGTMDKFVADRKAAGMKSSTINYDLGCVKRVLKLCAELWRDENGIPWLDTAPMLIKVQGETRKPRPITWAEQTLLLTNGGMPGYIAQMVEFVLNTGLRDQEVCKLKWSDECKISGSDATVFIIQQENAKNGRERIVPLNRTARAIIESRRGNGSDYVFDFKQHRVAHLNGRAWKMAIKRTGLTGVRVHDLRHTFGKRLRSAGVDFQNIQDLLGHYNGSITTHYCAAEIFKLIECVELLCDNQKPELTLVRKIG